MDGTISAMQMNWCTIGNIWWFNVHHYNKSMIYRTSFHMREVIFLFFIWKRKTQNKTLYLDNPFDMNMYTFFSLFRSLSLAPDFIQSLTVFFVIHIRIGYFNVEKSG